MAPSPYSEESKENEIHKMSFFLHHWENVSHCLNKNTGNMCLRSVCPNQSIFMFCSWMVNPGLSSDNYWKISMQTSGPKSARSIQGHHPLKSL